MYKKRGYTRETPPDLVRDYRLFAISCEGGRREPEYFRVFEHLSKKIKVDVIEDKIHSEEIIQTPQTKSSPKWVLDRAVKYIEQEGLIDEDELWFVMDVDRWKKKQLYEINDFCEEHPNWHIVLSNPCFEVWLYFHKKANIGVSSSKTCSDLKKEISAFNSEGYCPLQFLMDLRTAIKNARENDNNKDHFYPDYKTSKVYLLAEAILKIISEKDINYFIEQKLPNLIEIKRKASKSK